MVLFSLKVRLRSVFFEEDISNVHTCSIFAIRFRTWTKTPLTSWAGEGIWYSGRPAFIRLQPTETTVIYDLEGPFALGRPTHNFSPTLTMNQVGMRLDKDALLQLKYADGANKIPSFSQQYVQIRR